MLQVATSQGRFMIGKVRVLAGFDRRRPGEFGGSGKAQGRAQRHVTSQVLTATTRLFY